MRLEQALFAEDIRTEQTGQLTLVGFIPGDLLLILNPENPPFLKLACVFVLGYMEGISSFHHQVEVTFGNEVLLRGGRAQAVRDPSKKIHSLVMAFVPPPYRGPGLYRYKLIIDVGGATHSFSKNLLVQRSPDSAAQRPS